MRDALQPANPGPVYWVLGRCLSPFPGENGDRHLHLFAEPVPRFRLDFSITAMNHRRLGADFFLRAFSFASASLSSAFNC